MLGSLNESFSMPPAQPAKPDLGGLAGVISSSFGVGSNGGNDSMEGSFMRSGMQRKRILNRKSIDQQLFGAGSRRERISGYMSSFHKRG